MEHAPWVLRIFLEPEFLPLGIVLFARTRALSGQREKRKTKNRENIAFFHPSLLVIDCYQEVVQMGSCFAAKEGSTGSVLWLRARSPVRN